MENETCESMEPSGCSVQTWDLLQQIGFGPDSGVVSDVQPGLSFDFGNFKLSASCVMGRYFREVVLLTGTYFTVRSGCLICDEMPRGLESRELGLAWVTYCLDKAAKGEFVPRVPTAWLAEGRLNRHLLPWERQRIAAERERVEYEARPHCYVDREWARVGLKALATESTAVDDCARATFGFDGEVLTIRCPNKVLAMPATGAKWPQEYSIPLKTLSQQSKRLIVDPVEFSVWGNTLTIGRRRFAGLEQKGRSS